MKKVTLLDLGGVVFQSTGVSNDKINWKIISKLNHRYGHDLNIGKDCFGAFMNDYNQLTEQSLTGAAFLKEVFDTLEINRPLIERLQQSSDIIIVSDNYRENINYISQRYQFSDWAMRQIYSFDYQMAKANPAFFQRLRAELSKYDVSEMLFIDDSPEKLASAKQQGIEGIRFINNEQIFEALDGMDY